jgi:uncharacterized protein YlxP (DUF503 family)
MTVGVLTITMAIPADTLKEKRAIVKSVIERFRNRFNAAVAEVEDMDIPSRSVIAAVCVSNEAKHAQAMLQSIADAVVSARLDVEVLDISTELLAL